MITDATVCRRILPADELAHRFKDHEPAPGEVEARLAANPDGSASRKLQEALAARGWTGTWNDVGPSQGAAPLRRVVPLSYVGITIGWTVLFLKFTPVFTWAYGFRPGGKQILLERVELKRFRGHRLTCVRLSGLCHQAARNGHHLPHAGRGVYVGVRMHPIVVLWHVVLIVAGLVGALALTTGGTGSSGFHLVIWLLFFVLVAWAGSRIIDWRLTYFIITENRLLLVTGVVSKSIGMMPLAKVTDMRLERSPLGRVFGYGKFVIESAGQEQALRDVPFVPYPQQLYQEILAMIFPKKPSGRPGDDPGS